VTTVVGTTTSVVIGVIALLHLAWAFTPWPFADRERFAQVVVGLPGAAALPRIFPVMSLAVAVGLGVAAYVVAAEADLVPAAGGRLLTIALWAIVAVFALRGVAGPTGLMDSDGRPDVSRRMDLRVYSPLCIALAVGAAVVALG